VVIAAPPTEAIGIVSTGDNPSEEFKIPAMYPPSPIKRAPPRQTIPTKFAKKSKEIESNAKIHIIHTTLCQYILGNTKGMIKSPRIKISHGAIR
jgi:hypothetical protein